MTEFKRTVQAVDQIEQLVRRVIDSGGPADVQQLSEAVGSVLPTVQKIRQKASETDPAKQIYGEKMREKVRELAERWDSIEGLARDVLSQRGASVAQPALPELAPPPPAPAPRTTTWVPPHIQAPAQAMPREDVVPKEPVPSVPAGSTVPGADGPSKRELAARAAEARLGGGQAKSSTVASAASTQAATSQASAATVESTGRPVPAQVTSPPQPRVARMDALLHLVHCVFLGHGFTRSDVDAGKEAEEAALQGPGPFHIHYKHKSHQSITATYIPVQSHLIVYARFECGEQGTPGRAAVQLGMPAESVQAKVDYLLLYPLVHHQCLPTICSLPPEVCFGVLADLAIPALAAVGRTSRGLSTAVFQDDVLWWRVLLALPPSSRLKAALGQAMEAHKRGEAVPAGTYRQLAKEQVTRAREEAEEQRLRMEAERRMRERMRDPLLVQPQPRPFRGGPGGFMIGGPDDLAPGGGFLPPGPFGGGGGRRPFGGGGGGGFGGIF